MYILSMPYFFLAKGIGSPLGEVLGLIQAFLRYSYSYFLTSASLTGNILYYLLAGSTESDNKSISWLIALSVYMHGSLKTSMIYYRLAPNIEVLYLIP